MSSHVASWKASGDSGRATTTHPHELITPAAYAMVQRRLDGIFIGHLAPSATRARRRAGGDRRLARPGARRAPRHVRRARVDELGRDRMATGGAGRWPLR